jgi:hypothetical protein
VGQHDFAIMLEILKGGDRVSQIVNNSFAHMALHAVPYNEETHGREACGNQQHGEEKAGTQPGPVHEGGSRLSCKSLRRGF